MKLKVPKTYLMAKLILTIKGFGNILTTYVKIKLGSSLTIKDKILHNPDEKAEVLNNQFYFVFKRENLLTQQYLLSQFVILTFKIYSENTTCCSRWFFIKLCKCRIRCTPRYRGPVMFLLHINDISAEINSSLRLFADDCVLYRIIK